MTRLNEQQRKLIYQKISLNGRTVILLLDKDGKENISDIDLNANVFCIDEAFNIIWRIKAEQTKFKQDPFTSIKTDECGKIHTRRFSGFEYELNPSTGEAKISGWNK